MEPRPREAKFNAGLAKLERIDSIRKAIHSSKIGCQWHVAGRSLTAWRHELHDRMNEGERKVADDHEQAILKLRMRHAKGTSFPVYCLDQYERFLSIIESRYGLGMIDKDSDESDYE